MSVTYHHEWITDDEGWNVCRYCQRTTKDITLFSSVQCAARTETDEPEANHLEPVEYKVTRAVSDEVLANTGPGLKNEVWKNLECQLMEKLRNDDLVMVGQVQTTLSTMTTVPGYAVFAAKVMAIKPLRSRTTRLVSRETYNTSALSSFSITAEEALLHEQVMKEMRKRTHHDLYDVRYSAVPFGDNDMLLAADFSAVPKNLKGQRIAAP